MADCTSIDNTVQLYAGHCRGGFDFPLLFEESILIIDLSGGTYWIIEQLKYCGGTLFAAPRLSMVDCSKFNLCRHQLSS